MSDQWRLREWVPPEPRRRGSNGKGAAAPSALSYPDFPDIQPFRAPSAAYDQDARRLAPPALPNRQPPQFNPRGLARPLRGSLPRSIPLSRFSAASAPPSPSRLPPRYLPPVPSLPPSRLLPPVLPRPPVLPVPPSPPARPVTEGPAHNG
ncbi:hypothetical protein [Micromonospora fulviviridis]|uniref:Uncharacterized protein n=1 Tax=Micromonospora fulviviridis TaxID=47860 RepID=A0ABV2VTW2_9ACTN